MKQFQKKSFSYTKTFFKQFDLFGKEVNLNYQKQNKYKTALGGIGTVVFLTLIIIFFFRSITLFLSKERITVKKTQSYDGDPSTITIDPKEMIFAMKMNHDNFATRPMFNVTMKDRFYERLEGGEQNRTETTINLEPCTLEHFTNLNSHNDQIDWVEKFNLYGLNDYICPPKDYQFKLGGMYTSDKFYFQKITLSLCQNATEVIDDSKTYTSACATQEEIEEYRTSDYSNFSIYFPNKLINPDDTETPVRDFFFDEVFFEIQAGKMYRSANIFFREAEIQTDESIWPYEDLQYKKVNLFEPGDFRDMFSIGQDYVADFFLRRSPQSVYYERKFQKVDDIIAYIGGFIQAVIIGAGFVIGYYNDLQFTMQLANQLYNFDDKEKKKENDKQGKVKEQLINLYQLPDKNSAQEGRLSLKPGHQAKRSSSRIFSMHSKDIKAIIIERQQYLDKIMKNKENTVIFEQDSQFEDSKRISSGVENYIVNSYRTDLKIQKKKYEKIPKSYLNQLYEGLGFKSRNEFLYNQFKEIVENKRSISLNIKYFINKLTLGKVYKTNPKVELMNQAYERIQSDLDIYQILDNIKEIDKFKNVLFDKDQQKLFNFFPKPTISVTSQNYSEDENFLKIISAANKDNIQQSQKANNQNQSDNNFKNLQIGEIVLAQKVARKIKNRIKMIKNKETLNQDQKDMITFQELYDSYDILLTQTNNKIVNNRLINLLGDELQSIFETSQMIYLQEELDPYTGKVKEKNVDISSIYNNISNKNEIYQRVKNNNINQNKQEITKISQDQQKNLALKDELSVRESSRNMLNYIPEEQENTKENSQKNIENSKQMQQENQNITNRNDIFIQEINDVAEISQNKDNENDEEISNDIVIDTEPDIKHQRENLKDKIILQDQQSQNNNRDLMQKIGKKTNLELQKISIHENQFQNENNL